MAVDLGKSYNFSVYINNKAVPFSKVSGIESHLVTETVQEGGKNNTEYQTKKKEKPQNTLTLERAFPKTKKEHLRFEVGQIIEDEITVYLTDDAGEFYWGYYFIGCVVSKISLSALDAGKSDLLIQTMEITFQRMEEETFV